jgi:salicylate hydroxylase
MAIEDAAALGILFNKKYFNGDVAQSLEAYEKVRLPRATRVQAAAAKAAYNINERIGKYLLLPKKDRTILMRIISGFSVNKDTPTYKVEDPKKVLTIEEMNS